MSKAFTREDDASDRPALPKPVALLPPGTRNLVTSEGKIRLQAELTRLIKEERPVLVEGSLTDLELRPELAQLDQRINYLERSLATAEVVVPSTGEDRVRFGATVTVRDPRGEESTYRIVGVDEADFERHEISWLSPLAVALLNARSGQRVPFKAPSGVTHLEVVRIE